MSNDKLFWSEHKKLNDFVCDYDLISAKTESKFYESFGNGNYMCDGNANITTLILIAEKIFGKQDGKIYCVLDIGSGHGIVMRRDGVDEPIFIYKESPGTQFLVDQAEKVKRGYRRITNSRGKT